MVCGSSVVASADLLRRLAGECDHVVAVDRGLDALGLHADVADAAFPIMLCSMPFWLAGFWRPFGMRAEELLPLLAAHELSPQLLAYEPCLAGSLPEGSPRPGRPGRRARRRASKKQQGE